MNARVDHLNTSAATTAAPTPFPDLNAEQQIGQIAVQVPGATAVFRRLKIDFCCGGQVSLAHAAAEKGLDVAEVLKELVALRRSDSVPSAQTPSALVDHIIARYHEVHRAQFPELIRMARRVEAVHRTHGDVPSGLGDLLEEMYEELLTHMAKEEEVLFPMLKAGGNPFVGQPITVLRAEHVEHGAALDKLNALTHDATPPQDACNTWRALYAGIAQLGDDLIGHIHLENNVLFPQFETAAKTAATGAATQGCGPSGCGCQ